MKIGVCVPCYDGRVHDAHASSLLNIFAVANRAGIELELFTTRGCSILPEARNFLVASALSRGCDKVWFVDSDIAWADAQPVLNMLLTPAPIVCATYQGRNTKWNDPARFIVRWGKIPPDQDEETGLWLVEAVGTGCLVIDRSVFDALAESGIAEHYIPHGASDFESVEHLPFYRNWFDYLRVEYTPPEALQEKLRGVGLNGPYFMNLGEDFYFSKRVRELGFKILVDPRVELTHFDGCVQHNASPLAIKFEPA